MAVAVLALLHLQSMQDAQETVSRLARLPQLVTHLMFHQEGCRGVFYIFLVFNSRRIAPLFLGFRDECSTRVQVKM